MRLLERRRITALVMIGVLAAGVCMAHSECDSEMLPCWSSPAILPVGDVPTLDVRGVVRPPALLDTWASLDIPTPPPKA